MLYCDKIDVCEGIEVHLKNVMFVTIGIFQISVLSFNQMSAIDVMIY